MNADALSSALEAVLARFATLLRNVGYRHRLSDPEMDELLQSVRLRLWRARESGEMIEATSASYIYRTAVTASLDLIRARREQRETAIDTTIAGTADTARLAESDELAGHVSAALETIAPSRRPVVRMYLAGYPREEIAGLLGWSEAKVRNLLYRGLADLRAALLARGIGMES